MGRPIERRYFGVDNVNDGLAYSLAGGEGVNYVNVTNPGSNYSLGATITFSPSPIGGTTTTGTLNFFATDGTGNLGIQGVTVTNAGTGYEIGGAPTVTVVPPANVTVTSTAFSGNLAGNVLTVTSTAGLYIGMHTTGGNLAITSHIQAIWTNNSNILMSAGTTSTYNSAYPLTFYDRGYLQGVAAFTAVLYTPDVTANTIQGNAWTVSSGTGKICDIVKQQGARLYDVTNANDTAYQCRLVPTGTNGVNSPTIAAVTSAGGPTAIGEMTIQATDHLSGTYWVTKLEGRTATIVSGGTGTPGTFWADYQGVPWTSTGAATSTTVSIAQNA